MESTGKALLEKDPEDVMQAVREVVVEGRGAENHRRKLLGYYRDNLERMRYREFREQGPLIGSGAMNRRTRQSCRQE